MAPIAPMKPLTLSAIHAVVGGELHGDGTTSIATLASLS